MSKSNRSTTKKRGFGGLLLDFILVLCTGGLWLIWILIRYLRNNSWAITKYLTEILKRCLGLFYYAKEKVMKYSKKIGTKEHYLQVNNHMGKIMDKLLEKHPDSEQELKELFLGVQILNNEYILKSHPEFLSDWAANSGSFFMPFPPREKNMSFYEERSKKSIFKNRHSLFSFEKLHERRLICQCSKVNFNRSSLRS